LREVLNITTRTGLEEVEEKIFTNVLDSPEEVFNFYLTIRILGDAIDFAPLNLIEEKYFETRTEYTREV
jgi:hypothetical protein